MPWYAWLFVGIGCFLVTALISLAVLRATQRGRRFLHLSIKGKLRVVRQLVRDPLVPWPAKVAIAIVGLYLAMPFDLIPDFIPIVGQIDDIAVVIAGVAIMVGIVPKERFEAALDAAEALDAEARALKAREVNRAA